jgi:hypothetical protein
MPNIIGEAIDPLFTSELKNRGIRFMAPIRA